MGWTISQELLNCKASVKKLCNKINPELLIISLHLLQFNNLKVNNTNNSFIWCYRIQIPFVWYEKLLSGFNSLTKTIFYQKFLTRLRQVFFQFAVKDVRTTKLEIRNFTFYFIFLCGLTIKNILHITFVMLAFSNLE